MQRLATLAEKNQITYDKKENSGLSDEYIGLMDNFEFSKAFDLVWNKIQGLNKQIDEDKPWSLAKNDEKEKLNKCMNSLIGGLLNAVYELSPFLPDAAEKIIEVFEGSIHAPKAPLFPKS